MKAFKASGSYKVSKFDRQKFTLEVAAESEDGAKHKIVSDFGSKHKLSRKDIHIDEIAPIKNEDITDPVVKYLVGGHK